MMAQLNWPELSRKRSREEGLATGGFEEHRTKRLQCLPLRTLPTSRRLPPLGFPSMFSTSAPVPPRAPHTITPADSDSDDAARQPYRPESRTWADCSGPTAQQPSPTWMHVVDQDMDMFDSPLPDPGPNATEEASFRHHPAFDSAFLQQSAMASNNMVGRMPTPIHATFGAQIRGNNWAGAAGNPISHQAAFRANVENLEAQHVRHVTGGHDCVPRSLGDGPGATEAVMQSWNLVQNRRLPSPISECGGEDSVLGSPVMVLESSSSAAHPHVNQHGHGHPMVAGLPQRSPGPARPSTPAVDAGMCPGNAMDIEQPVTSSPRKGHTRSRHTLNSWTAAQPGMKKSFSMGYRADCEKCRLKVPGHFNHIIISWNDAEVPRGRRAMHQGQLLRMLGQTCQREGGQQGRLTRCPRLLLQHTCALVPSPGNADKPAASPFSSKTNGHAPMPPPLSSSANGAKLMPSSPLSSSGSGDVSQQSWHRQHRQRARARRMPLWSLLSTVP